MRVSPTRFHARMLRFAIAAAVALLFAGCGGSGDAPPSTGNPDAHPILGVASFGAGQVTVISDNALADGDVVRISGTQAYDGSYTVFAVTSRTFAIRAPFVGNEARGTQTKAGGAAFGCTPSGATAQVALARSASRVQGVAPLTVFFDATATTAASTARPFHELDYRWDFGDATSGEWATGPRTGLSRNLAAGPLAGHVFERPGIYRVALSVTDGTNTATDSCLEIAVQDPDVIHAGANTICIGSATLPVAGAGGCPAGAATAIDPSFCNAVSARLAPGRRLLFDAAGVFSCATNALVTANGPWTVGAFPVVPGGGARATVVTNRTSDGAILRIGGGPGSVPADGRLMNIDMSWLPASPSSARVESIVGAGNFDRLTLLRLSLHDLGDGLQFRTATLDQPGNDHVWDHLAIVDNRIRRIGTGSGERNGVRAGGSRLMMLGNLVDDTPASGHPARFDHLDRAVIAYNTFTNGPDGKPALAVFGTEQAPAGTGYLARVLPAPSPTQRVLVTDNAVSIAGTTGLAVTTPGGGTDVLARDVISERNAYWAPLTSACTGGPCAEAAVATQATRHTVRNEIVHFGNFRAFSLVQGLAAGGGMAAADGIDAFHNTGFGALNSADGTAAMLRLATGTSNVRVRNNLMYVPGITLTTAVAECDGGCGGVVGLQAASNSTDATAGDQMRFASPNFNGTPLPTFGIGTWKPVASYASTQSGAPAPVFSDFYGTPRTTSRLGAVMP